jgi:hypothetical protein
VGRGEGIGMEGWCQWDIGNGYRNITCNCEKCDGKRIVTSGVFLKIGNADICGILTKAYQKIR